MNQQKPDFDSIKQINPYGEEYWYARQLMPLLGYSKWERFAGAIKRAMIACENTGNIIDRHFPSAGKTSSGQLGESAFRQHSARLQADGTILQEYSMVPLTGRTPA